MFMIVLPLFWGTQPATQPFGRVLTYGSSMLASMVWYVCMSAGSCTADPGPQRCIVWATVLLAAQQQRPGIAHTTEFFICSSLGCLFGA